MLGDLCRLCRGAFCNRVGRGSALRTRRRRRAGVARLLTRRPTNVVPIALVAQARRWFDRLTGGDVGSIQEIARRDGIDASDIGRNIQLAFLAPDIVEAILVGRQPVELTARRHRRIGALPLEWDRQRLLLGFPA